MKLPVEMFSNVYNVFSAMLVMTTIVLFSYGFPPFKKNIKSRLNQHIESNIWTWVSVSVYGLFAMILFVSSIVFTYANMKKQYCVVIQSR